jgi:hypothetical protein
MFCAFAATMGYRPVSYFWRAFQAPSQLTFAAQASASAEVALEIRFRVQSARKSGSRWEISIIHLERSLIAWEPAAIAFLKAERRQLGNLLIAPRITVGEGFQKK